MSTDDCNGCRSEDCDACVTRRQHAKHDELAEDEFRVRYAGSDARAPEAYLPETNDDHLSTSGTSKSVMKRHAVQRGHAPDCAIAVNQRHDCSCGDNLDTRKEKP